ncbi:RAB, member of RAS oncogene family-like 2 isoform X2 [Hypanus sabinus]|uniref:RAB, member of RAS oncogene family-like 2 isoform X2 n=1 Tax=Hypanus sabinus TaxID=79690 RepID=UPI0028C45AFD|nr:RAB, member of RAS oncogene family-like 2 isoform X2 [Hypanus sabinus]
MAAENSALPELNQDKYDGDEHIKIICLGDSAVGKSKKQRTGIRDPILAGCHLPVEFHRSRCWDCCFLRYFWDTAGQERFQSMHPSYYHKAHACIMVFDVQRKITYKNLSNWYTELRESRPEIPCVIVANKIDADMKITQKSFNFAKKHGLPFYFVSAADGTNVVKLFRDTIKLAVSYKENSSDFMDEVMRELENFDLEADKEARDDQPKEDQSESP